MYRIEGVGPVVVVPDDVMAVALVTMGRVGVVSASSMHTSVLRAVHAPKAAQVMLVTEVRHRAMMVPVVMVSRPMISTGVVSTTMVHRAVMPIALMDMAAVVVVGGLIVANVCHGHRRFEDQGWRLCGYRFR